MVTKYKIVYFGTWGYGYAGLRSLYSLTNVDILNVYTRWSENQIMYFNNVMEFCEANRIPYVNSSRDKMNKYDFENSVLSNNDVDFIVSCCYDRILSKSILEHPKYAAINIHPSLLPKYRGVKPLENAIVNNESYTGVTIHILKEEIDSGNILLQKGGIEIEESSTYKVLYNKQCEMITELIAKFFNNPLKYYDDQYEQSSKYISFAPRLNIIIEDNNTVKEIREKYKNQRLHSL